MKPFASLQSRLLAALTGVFAVGMGATALMISTHAASVGEVLEDSSLQAQARALAAGLRFDGAGRLSRVALPPAWGRAYAEGLAGYAVYRPGGVLEAASPTRVAPPEAITAHAGAMPLRLVGPRQDLEFAMRGPAGRTVAVERVNPGAPQGHPPDPWEDVAPVSIMAMLSLLGLAMAWLVARWSLAPLRRATAEAALIGPERPEARISEADLPAEVRPLAAAINLALERVASAYAAERRFTADAAHALRTPLSVLDLRLQRAEAGGRLDWPVVRADLAELARVVSGVLTLSRADRGARPDARKEVNLARLVREVAASAAPALEAQGRTLQVSAPAVVQACAEAGELRDLLYALLDNARAHGSGEVVIELTDQAHEIVLRVRDAGAGVEATERERMFERFRQGDPSRGGAGLGLAIVRQAARNHGGEARFRSAAEIEVRLPKG